MTLLNNIILGSFVDPPPPPIVSLCVPQDLQWHIQGGWAETSRLFLFFYMDTV